MSVDEARAKVDPESTVAAPALAERLLDLPELASAWQPLELAAGQALFAEGDPGDAFYSIVDGEIEIHVAGRDGNRVVLERLSAGAHLGELALIDGGARSAGARAITDCRLRRLRREDFLSALPQLPALSSTTIELLSSRMRRNAEYISLVSRWARRVASGDYQAARAQIEAEAAAHQDPNVEPFVRTFVEMIAAVQAREARLERELASLRIEVDRRQYEEQLAEVTESEFFRSLQSNARQMRQRIRGEDDDEVVGT